MARVTVLLNKFFRGEVGELVAGRLDTDAYQQSYRILKNVIPVAQGPGTRRPGTYYVGTGKTDADVVRLYPYIYSNTEAYMLELGDGYFRVYKMGSAGYGERLGTVEVTANASWVTAELFEIQFVQDGADLWMVHPNWKPRYITRDAVTETTWAITIPTFAGVTFAATDEYPSAIALYESRMIFAATNDLPQTIWGSVVGDYDDFQVGTGTPSDAFIYKIGDNRANRIMWLQGGPDLLIGTTGNTFIMNGGGSPLAPDSVLLKPQVNFGSADLNALRVGSNVVYLLQDRKTVRALQYSYERSGYQAPNVTMASHHITGEGITQWDLQTTPYNILWATREDGTLIGWSNEAPHLDAWHRHPMEDGIVESVAVIPNGSEDVVWMSVQRTVDGTTQRFLEHSMPFDFGDQEDAFFVECGLTFDGGAAEDITGATRADPVVITCVSHPFNTGDIVRIEDVGGMTALNDRYFEITDLTADTFSIALPDGSDDIDGTLFTLTVDVDPSPGNFTVGGTITGASSTETCEVVSVVDSKNYICRNKSGPFDDGEVLSDGTNSADCGTGYPGEVDTYATYTTGGTAQKYYKTIPTTEADKSTNHTGLSHLEGESLHVIIDGANHPVRTVATGAVTLQEYANVVHLGKFSAPEISPLRIEGGGETGPSLGKIKKIDYVTMRFYRTLGAQLGVDEDTLYPVLFRKGSDPMDSPPPLFTGDIRQEFDGDYTSDNYLLLTSDQALPFTVVALAVEMDTHEGD